MKIQLRCTALIIFCALLGFFACDTTGEYNKKTPLTYPIELPVITTLIRTIVPDNSAITDPLYPAAKNAQLTILPNDVEHYSDYNYGVWGDIINWDYANYWGDFGEGEPPKKRHEIMAEGYTPASNAASLLRFFTISDVHIQDVQCPAGLLINGLQNGNERHQGNSSAYSPIIPYTTHVLDAAVQTVNALHQKQAFDFGIFLGDATNSSAYNELRWYINVIDGGTINPNSDPISSYNSDYTREFKAAGLDKSIPWYQVLGNHDHFFLGTWAQTTKSLSAYKSEFIMDIDENLPNILNGTGYYGGVVDASTPYGVVKYAGLKTDFSPVPTINANPDRRGITRYEWISEFFKTTSYPKGHGFIKDSNPDACYSFEPKAGLPLKVIVLDDTETDEVEGENGWLGYLDHERYAWLVNELEEGQNHDKLMIIAAHVPISLQGLWDNATSDPDYTDLITKLHKYPNLILWISGHVHRNTVTKMPSPDIMATPNHPERGFWVVETSSLRDFPQQFRTFDIIRNNDNTISIIITNVDPSVKEGSPAAKSRSYAVAASQLFTAGPVAPIVKTHSQAYNAELFIQLSPAMQIIIQEYGTPIH